MKQILNFLLPPRCACCGENILTAPGVCAGCWEKFHFIDHPLCDICGRPFEIAEIEGTICASCLTEQPLYHRLRSAFPYDDISKSLILQFKHGDATHLTPLLVNWLKRAGSSILEDSHMIVPVPLHWQRLWRRSYNQAALLAQGLSKLSRKAYEPCLLKRHKNNPSQGQKNLKQRRENVKGNFSFESKKKHKIAEKNIMLVDDVYTSGATINECVKILYQNGANQVNVLTLARVLHLS